MIANGLLKNRQGSLRDFVLFQLTELRLVKFRFGNVHVLAVERVKAVGYNPRLKHIPHSEFEVLIFSSECRCMMSGDCLVQVVIHNSDFKC